MIFYGLVSADIEQVIEFFPTRVEAEAMRRAVLEDEPEWGDLLRVVEVEFGPFAAN